MDIRKHINDVTDGALDHHRVLEGGCFDGGIYYLIFGNMRKGTSKIAKVKKGEEKEVLKVSKTLKIGHANDCCVRHGIIYITHSGSKSVIHRVSAKTLNKLSDIKVDGCTGGFNGISCMGKGYIVKKMASRKCYVLDEHWKYKKTITLSETMKTGQGIDWRDGKLYRASSQLQSTRNWVCVYNSKGKLIKRYHWKHKCELENVMWVGKCLNIGIYVKKKKGTKDRFRAYIKTLAKE